VLQLRFRTGVVIDEPLFVAGVAEVVVLARLTLVARADDLVLARIAVCVCVSCVCVCVSCVCVVCRVSCVCVSCVCVSCVCRVCVSCVVCRVLTA
jgi:hypothetical protein